MVMDLHSSAQRSTIWPWEIRSLLVISPISISFKAMLMNYYDPYQNICPKQVSYIQKFNEHLAHDVKGFGVISDVFNAFGGSKTPNPNICSYTWMCSIFHDIHATNKGYRAIASAFEKSTGY
jgi:hypothetical protein